MIVLDIETSGLNFNKCGIWQIGALDLNNPLNVFLDEARIDEEDEIEEGALRVTGKTSNELRDTNKKSQKELIESFFNWFNQTEYKNCICQNPQFDLGFLIIKSVKYGLKIPFHYRSFDLHSIASFKYFQIHGKFLIKEGRSDMGLTNTLNFCGLEDNRKEHNALEDCKLTAECFSRLLSGKSLFPKYNKFKIPEYLIQ